MGENCFLKKMRRCTTVGDDFWCTDPAGDPNGTFWLQGCHMVHCAFNSWWMGNFIHPDWDMFRLYVPDTAAFSE